MTNIMSDSVIPHQFKLYGEAVPEVIDDLYSRLAESGTHAFVITAESTSPSVAIEYLDGVDGMPVPAVTRGSMLDYLIASGLDESVALAKSSVLSRILDVHALHDHEALAGLAPAGINNVGNVCNGCPCPLRLTSAHTYFHPPTTASWVGIEPVSFVTYADLPTGEMQKYVRGVGPQHSSTIKSMAQQICNDLGWEN